MLKLFKQKRSCTQLGELVADGLDAGFMSLLAEFQKNPDKLGTTPEAIVREMAFLELFIAERAVNRMILERSFQDAVLLACIRRLVSLRALAFCQMASYFRMDTIHAGTHTLFTGVSRLTAVQAWHLSRRL